MEGKLHVKSFRELSAAELYRILRIREEVFFLEQGVTCEDLDGVDTECIHMWYEAAECIAGYLRIIPPGISYAEASIGRVLVRKEFRRRGISRMLMAGAMALISEKWPGVRIAISAQAYLTAFYGELGFQVVSGEYLDGGIPHYKMIK